MSPIEPQDPPSDTDTTNTTDTKPTTDGDHDQPIDVLGYAWPEAVLDPVDRMRVLAAALPHAASNETVFAVPFDRFWSFVSDLEQNTARFEGTVGRVRILERAGERLTLETRSPILGPWMRFEVVLRPGWCLMQSRIGEIGMAAREEDHGSTRFFHFEGSALFGRMMRPFFRWNIRQDFRRLRKLV